MHLLDVAREFLVGTGPSGGSTRAPGVVATPRDTEQAAHGRHRIVRLLRLDECEHGYRVMSLSLAKKAAAFFRISRSWRSVRTSRRSWRNSSRSLGANGSRTPSSISACCTQFRSV